MGAGPSTGNRSNAIKRILQVIRLDRTEISAIYFYAILAGIIQLSLPIGVQAIVSFVLGGSISTSLVILIALVVVGVFLGGLLQVNQMRLIEKVLQKIFVRYSFEFAHRIPRLRLTAVDDYYLPELVNRFFDTISLQKGISKLLLDIPAATIQILFGLILLSFYHPFFIIFGIALIVVVYMILALTSERGMDTSIRESDYKYGVASWLEEMARVVSSFKYSRNDSLNIYNTDKLVSGYLESRTAHFRILLVQYWSLIGFKVLITSGMLIMGSILLVNQQLNIGQFIAAEIVIIMVIGSVEKLIMNLDKVYDVLTSVEKLGKVIDKPLEHGGDTKLEIRHGGVDVALERVTFRYNPDDSKPALRNINFDVKPGEKVCLMGPTGSGKTSILKLLTAAYPDFEGKILINGLPIGTYDLRSLRSSTGIFLNGQDIFKGTLLENITMGDSSITETDIMILARELRIDTYLSEVKGGFATILEPTGRKLSRKLIQKILLLRALIKSPELLLLEEPMEHMEPDVREHVRNYLLQCKQTAIVSSYDTDFAERCDKIAYIENGELVAFGSWNDIKPMIQ